MHYAHNGDVSLAYQVLGEGGRDILLATGHPYMSLFLALWGVLVVGLGCETNQARALMAMKAPPQSIVGAILLGIAPVLFGARDVYTILAFACVGYAATANLRAPVVVNPATRQARQVRRLSLDRIEARALDERLLAGVPAAAVRGGPGLCVGRCGAMPSPPTTGAAGSPPPAAGTPPCRSLPTGRV